VLSALRSHPEKQPGCVNKLKPATSECLIKHIKKLLHFPELHPSKNTIRTNLEMVPARSQAGFPNMQP